MICNTTLDQLAQALGGDVVNGQVLAPGPGHSPKDRSMRVRLDPEAPDGFVVHSFAGDDGVACRDYVRERNGWPAFKPKSNGRAAGRPIATSASEDELAARRAAATARVDALLNKEVSGSGAKVVALYDYCDTTGTLLYQVERLEPKSFRQRRPDGNGGWIGNLKDTPRVPFRLVELIEDDCATVFFCEGEKDALRLVDLGLCTTTLSGGTKWTAEIAEYFRGREVIVVPDHDAAGARKAWEAASALHGIAASVRVATLPGLTGKPKDKDVSDWLDADPARAETLVDVCIAAPVWEPQPEPPDAPDEPTAADDVPLPFLDMTTWDAEPAPPRLWSVRDRIPLRQPALLSGEGAIGKTLLSLQLSAAHVLGRDWIGMLPEPGPAIYLGAEDEADEIHRRVGDIAFHYRASFADLIAGGLHLLSFAGQDAILGAANRAGIIEATPLFHRIHKAVCSIKPQTLAIDTSADVYAGNENDRAQVRQFVGLLRRLAIDGNCSVLLLSHPSLTGINTGTGLSGSTGWHNSVRASG
jgi:5S rRNA maturation endonuclease (ribonuclease M5)